MMHCAEKDQKRRGMTIIEVMIVVTIIGILAIISVPHVMNARRRSQDSRFMNNLRLITGNTFDFYGFEFGDFPPDAAPGVVPPLATPYLPKRVVWENDTSIGGQWDWDRAASRSEKIHGVYAGLTIYKPGRTRAQMKKIDKKSMTAIWLRECFVNIRMDTFSSLNIRLERLPQRKRLAIELDMHRGRHPRCKGPQ